MKLLNWNSYFMNSVIFSLFFKIAYENTFTIEEAQKVLNSKQIIFSAMVIIYLIVIGQLIFGFLTQDMKNTKTKKDLGGIFVFFSVVNFIVLALTLRNCINYLIEEKSGYFLFLLCLNVLLFILVLFRFRRFSFFISLLWLPNLKLFSYLFYQCGFLQISSIFSFLRPNDIRNLDNKEDYADLLFKENDRHH